MSHLPGQKTLEGNPVDHVWKVERKFKAAEDKGSTEKVARSLSGKLLTSTLVRAPNQSEALSAALEVFAGQDTEEADAISAADYSVRRK